MFQVYNSITHHVYIGLGAHDPNSSPSITIYLTCFSHEKKKKDKISETSDYRDLEVDSQYNPGQKCGIKNCEHSRKLYSLKEAKHTKQEVEISY